MAKAPKTKTKIAKKPTKPVRAKASKPQKPTSQTAKKRGRAWPPVPNLGSVGVMSTHGLMISPDELQQMAKTAGVQVRAENLEAASIKLRSAFYYTIMDGVSNDRLSANRVWRDWYEAVHQQAEGFLELLAFPGGKETLGLFDPEYAPDPKSAFNESPRSSLRALINGAFHDEIDTQLSRVPTGVRKAFQEPDYGLKTRAISAAPWVIALLSEIGRLGAEQYAESKQGRRGNIFKPMLLSRLAEVYELLTGAPPSGMRDGIGDYKPNPPPIMWLRAILGSAVERIPKYFTVANVEDVIEAIRELLGLEDATLAFQFKDKKL